MLIGFLCMSFQIPTFLMCVVFQEERKITETQLFGCNNVGNKKKNGKKVISRTRQYNHNNILKTYNICIIYKCKRQLYTRRSSCCYNKQNFLFSFHFFTQNIITEQKKMK